MSTTATREPSKVYAGDSMRWTKTLSDYPASGGWTLTYTFKDATGIKLEKDAVASGDDYLVTITPGETAAFVAGGLGWAAVVENPDGSERYTVGSGYLLVLANPAEGAGADPRSPAKQALDAINAILPDIAARPEGVITYADGKSITYTSPEQLIKMRSMLLAEVRQEEKAEKIAQGLDSGSNIRIRFSSI
jgi:hypothetical protein